VHMSPASLNRRSFEAERITGDIMTEQVLTVRCKLKPSEKHVEAIEETLKAFADACTWINQNVDPKIRGKIRIQHLIYQDVRAKYGLSSNLTIRAIARVAANRKTAGENKIEGFQPTSIDYDQRIFQYREADEQVSLTLLHGRERIPLDIGNYQRNLLKGRKPTLATLVTERSGYYMNIQVKSEGAKNIADLEAVVNQPGGPEWFCLIEAEKVPGLQKATLFRGG